VKVRNIRIIEYKISSKVYRNVARGKEGEWSVITLTEVCSAVHCATNHVGSTVRAHASEPQSRPHLSSTALSQTKTM
jgi:hypothetical protein